VQSSPVFHYCKLSQKGGGQMQPGKSRKRKGQRHLVEDLIRELWIRNTDWRKGSLTIRLSYVTGGGRLYPTGLRRPWNLIGLGRGGRKGSPAAKKKNPFKKSNLLDGKEDNPRDRSEGKGGREGHT